MALVFQERADGYRVVRVSGASERMVANVCSKRADEKLSKVSDGNPHGAVVYVPMPLAECTIHSAVGPMTVADLQEIIAGIPTA